MLYLIVFRSLSHFVWFIPRENITQAIVVHLMKPHDLLFRQPQHFLTISCGTDMHHPADAAVLAYIAPTFRTAHRMSIRARAFPLARIHSFPFNAVSMLHSYA